jgi:hypothetical protein
MKSLKWNSITEREKTADGRCADVWLDLKPLTNLCFPTEDRQRENFAAGARQGRSHLPSERPACFFGRRQILSCRVLVPPAANFDWTRSDEFPYTPELDRQSRHRASGQRDKGAIGVSGPTLPADVRY